MRSVLGLSLFLWAGTALAQPADAHSYARPEHVCVRHVDLDLRVDFERQQLSGYATLAVERTSRDDKQPLVLDARKLSIEKCETSADGKTFEEARFEVGKEDPIK